MSGEDINPKINSEVDIANPETRPEDSVQDQSLGDLKAELGLANQSFGKKHQMDVFRQLTEPQLVSEVYQSQSKHELPEEAKYQLVDILAFQKLDPQDRLTGDREVDSLKVKARNEARNQAIDQVDSLSLDDLKDLISRAEDEIAKDQDGRQKTFKTIQELAKPDFVEEINKVLTKDDLSLAVRNEYVSILRHQGVENPAEWYNQASLSEIKELTNRASDYMENAEFLGDGFEASASAETFEPPAEATEAVENPIPSTEKSPEAPLKVMLIDTSLDLHAAAVDFANKRLTEELAGRDVEGGKFKKIANWVKQAPMRFWKGNFLKEHYIRKYTQEAEDEMVADGNFLGGQASPEDLSNARKALFDRFGMEYEEMVHTEAGEKREVMAEDSQFVAESKGLIRNFVENADFDANSLQEGLTRLLQEHISGNDPKTGGDLLKVTNLMDIAEVVKGMVEHGHSLDRVLEGMQFISGESRTGVRTGLAEGLTDKVFEKMSKSRVLRSVAPDTLLVASGIAASMINWGGTRAASAAATALTIGGGAAITAGIRESRRTKEDRIQHQREMAQGGEIEIGSARRQEMESVRYETKFANDLTESLSELAKSLAESNEEHITTLEESLRALANINTRIKIGDRDGVDLISFSSQVEIGDERLALDMARAELRVQAEQLFSNLSPEDRAALGGDADSTIQQLVEARSTEFIDAIEGDIDAKDQAFKRLKAKRVAKAAATGLATGLAFSLLSQEVSAMFSDSKQGAIESLWNDGKTAPGADGRIHQTMLDQWINGDRSRNLTQSIPSQYGGELVKNTIPGTENEAYLPEGMKFDANGKGEMALFDRQGNIVVDDITIGPNGQIDPEDLSNIQQLGFGVTSSSQIIQLKGESVSETVEANPGDYVQQNGGVKVHRDYWYHNNTEEYDLNELGLHGGDVLSDNSIQYNVSNMTAEGSSFGDKSVNWREIASAGQMKLAVSASVETQGDVFLIPIDSEGNINISSDHPAYKLFEIDQGRATFKGAFAEACEVTTETANGSLGIRPLATVVGSDSIEKISTTVVETPVIAKELLTYEFAPPVDKVVETVVESAVDLGPVIPIVSRRPLERLAQARQEDGYYRGYDSYRDIERARSVYEPIFSERLRQDPDAELNPRQELDDFRQRLAERRGPDRVDRIDQQINSTPELANMSGEVKTIITMPVAAAQEAGSIYNVLSMYGRQSPDSLKGSLLMINLNWLDTMRDNQADQINQCRQEIDRAKKDFPDLKVAVIENEYDAKRVASTGGVIGYIASDMADAALLAIQKQMALGNMADDHEVLIIRNDADPEGLAVNYIEQYQKALDNPKNSKIDIFQGVTRFGNRWAEKYPGYALATNFDSVLFAVGAKKGRVHTGGANFGVRAKSFAAVGGVYDGSEAVASNTGAGSDDLIVGRKMAAARFGSGLAGDNYASSNEYSGDTRRRIVRRVSGAAVDTNPEALIPYYLEGKSIQDRWKGRGFSGGEGGYRARLANMPDLKIEGEPQELTREVFEAIEFNITESLRWSDDGDSARALALFFGFKGSGLYRLENQEDGAKTFKFTLAGRRFLRQRFGRGGRKIRGDYGRNLVGGLYDKRTISGKDYDERLFSSRN